MNRFRFSTLATAAAALATQMTFAPDASAAVTGFDGIEVDGTLYDVNFVPVGDVAPTPVFTSLDSANSASQALEDELFSYWQVHGEFVVRGCGYLCQIVTPDSSQEAFGSKLFIDTNNFAVHVISTVLTQPSPSPDLDYAIWTAEPVMTVPEPSPATLLGIGMAGVAGARAVRRKTKSG